MKKGEQITKAAGISNDAVEAKTGKTWQEWFKILDAAGAVKPGHKEIVAYLAENYKVSPWWRQMVTVAYEQERGLRRKHETPQGFQMSASKTIAVPVSNLFKERYPMERTRPAGRVGR